MDKKLESILSSDDILEALKEKENRYALSEVFINAYEQVENIDVEVHGFLYAEKHVLSDNEFDKFRFKGIVNLLNILEVKHFVEYINENGKLYFKIDNISFEVDIMEDMYDNIYSDFVDMKTIKRSWLMK